MLLPLASGVRGDIFIASSPSQSPLCAQLGAGCVLGSGPLSRGPLPGSLLPKEPHHRHRWAFLISTDLAVGLPGAAQSVHTPALAHDKGSPGMKGELFRPSVAVSQGQLVNAVQPVASASLYQPLPWARL